MSKQKGHKGPKPLPLLKFPGRVIAVRTVADASSALDELKNSAGFNEGVGIDMEWDADVSPTSNNPIAALQICSEDTCVIFLLIAMGNQIPDEVSALLTDESILKMAHVRKLCFRFYEELPKLFFHAV